MKKKRISIWGRKTITPPTPLMTPSTSRSRSDPSGMASETHSPSHSTPLSIHPIGISPNEKVIWNIAHISSRKIGKPHILWVMMRSIRAALRFLSAVPGVKVSLSAPAIKPYRALAITVSARSL